MAERSATRERRQNIAQDTCRGQATVEELSERFGVTASTIRRDLAALTKQGQLTRTYGGAAPSVERTESSLGQRSRFVFAGSKAQPEDRLIDLVICCEALFLKRHGIEGSQKGAPAAVNAGRFLADDPLLNVEREQVERFVRAAYRLRNAEVHGDHPVRRSLTLLCGATTEDLAQFVEDHGLVVRRALHLVLSELAYPARGSRRGLMTVQPPGLLGAAGPAQFEFLIHFCGRRISAAMTPPVPQTILDLQPWQRLHKIW